MNRHIRLRWGARGRGRLSAGFAIPGMAVAGIAMLVLSCADGAVEPPPPAPAPVATTVTVNPASATLTALEETVRFTADVRDQNGQVMAGTAVAWASSDAAVAAVDASGLVTAVANGSATITATAGSISGTAEVTVAQEIATVTVTPPADTLVALGDTVRLTAEATDANGHGVVGVMEFEWSSNDTLVAQVDDSGLVESRAEGEAAVTATASEVTGGAELTVVSPLPTTIAVSPDTVRFTALGQTVQVTTEVREQAGRVMSEAVVSWSSADTLVVVVDSAGLVTSVGEGITTVTAAAGDVSGSIAVTVTQSAGSVVVSPSEGTIGVGDTLRLVAEAFDENGHRVSGAVFSWSSGDARVARVDETGRVDALAEGTARITAVSGDASDVAEITVENPDRAALVALYEATDGPNWVNNENWLTDAPLAEWYGVETDALDRVVSLRLREYGASFGLNGTIPPEIGNLIRLQVLDLRNNALRGGIPPEVGNLTRLRRLDLSNNQLTGSIPAELGKLADLESLDLADNGLNGEIPRELGNLTKLDYLRLSRNRLEGGIPVELAKLQELSRLNVQQNNLTGPIPPEFGNLTNLRTLWLQGNELTGRIPPQLGNLTRLEYLNLQVNNLTGPLPPELANLTELRSVSFDVNNLTGPLPPWLGNLRKLETLHLGSNNLTGVIPSELGNLKNLKSLNLRNNGLTGSIPPELGTLVDLERFYLDNNLLTGHLPLTFLRLTKLISLGCRGEESAACVPSTDEFRAWFRAFEARGATVDFPFCDEIDAEALKDLFRVANGTGWTRSDGWLGDENLDRWHGVRTDEIGRVAGIDLSGNGLSGHLPTTLGNLANMTELRVADNALVGAMPIALAGVSLEAFDHGGTSLCVPDDAGFREWLNGIPRRSGTAGTCPPLTDREVLELMYRDLGGSRWYRSAGWLTRSPLNEWYGVATDAAGRIVGLRLPENNLTGSLPQELGQLATLKVLDLAGNRLAGQIPRHIGRSWYSAPDFSGQ